MVPARSACLPWDCRQASLSGCHLPCPRPDGLNISLTCSPPPLRAWELTHPRERRRLWSPRLPHFEILISGGNKSQHLPSSGVWQLTLTTAVSDEFATRTSLKPAEDVVVLVHAFVDTVAACWCWWDWIFYKPDWWEGGAHPGAASSFRPTLASARWQWSRGQRWRNESTGITQG